MSNIFFLIAWGAKIFGGLLPPSYGLAILTAVGYAKNDYWLTSDLPATIFGQSSAQYDNWWFFIDLDSAASNKIFSTFCTVFLKLRYRDIVTFRTKNWMDNQEKLLIDSLQTTNFTFSAVTWKNIVWSFSVPLWCNKHLPEQCAIICCFKFLGLFVSMRT